MTPTFDRLDLLPDAAFGMWVAVVMVAVGLVIGAFMVARWLWRWTGRKRWIKRAARWAYCAIKVNHLYSKTAWGGWGIRCPHCGWTRSAAECDKQLGLPPGAWKQRYG